MQSHQIGFLPGPGTIKFRFLNNLVQVFFYSRSISACAFEACQVVIMFFLIFLYYPYAMISLQIITVPHI
jgi:hypothetical protein